jgi:hypothetical protein
MLKMKDLSANADVVAVNMFQKGGCFPVNWSKVDRR